MLYVLYILLYVLYVKYNVMCRPSACSFTLRGRKFFKKGQLQDRLKKLSLEQDPGHNTR